MNAIQSEIGVISSMAQGKYKIRIVKLGKPSVYMFNVKSVDKDDKHQYFIITTCIWHNDITQTISYKECDYIEMFENDSTTYGMFSPITQHDTPIRVLRKE